MKGQRQSAILNLIQKNEIETQEELGRRLIEAGFNVTQATISRDIRELKLTKVNSKTGGQKYASLARQEHHASEKMIRIFKDALLSMDRAQNILVIRTLSGMGDAVAAAIDAFHVEEIVGTLAGDDTIFCATRCEKDIDIIMDKFTEILNS
ncbi:MAG: arginine repressor [Epulopiscium sp.]|nr:arginine repressor [Candidatus Epulonipiscium sp.]